MFLQFRQERNLARKKFLRSKSNGKPTSPIYFGKFRLSPGFWRPLHRKCIAQNRAWIAIPFDCPRVDDLAAGLPLRRKLKERSINRKAGFLGELPSSSVHWIITVVKFPLWN